MQNSAVQNKIYFKNLDILRFIAVFLVLIAHAYEGWCGWYGIPGFMTVNEDFKNLTFFGQYLDTAIKNGGFGVDIFFLISGFLITFILLKEKEVTGRINILKFFIRRAFRIWPVYFLLISLTPWFVYLANASTPDYLPNIFFYNNFHAIKIKEWQYPFAHLWSICVEEHFYVIWPFIIYFINYKYLKKTFLLIIFISLFSRVLFFIYKYDNLYIYLHTLSRIDVLILGAFYAIYFKENGFNIKTSKFSRMIIYLVFILVYLLEPVYLNETLYTAAVKKYFYCGIIGFAMINFLFNPDPLFRIPFQKLLNYLGKISYSIYIFSNVLIPIIVIQIMWRFNIQNMYIFFALNIILSIVISLIVYELFEKQILKFKKRFEIIKTTRTE